MNWAIANLEYEIDGALLSNVVKIIHWTVIKETDGFAANAYGTQSLGLPGTDFIAYEGLQEAVVLGWLFEALGPEQVAQIEANLDTVIAEQASPTIGVGIPWSDPIPVPAIEAE